MKQFHSKHIPGKKQLYEVKGYALVENVMVMPVVFVIIYALLFCGCMLHAQTTIDAAARRGVRYAARLICDPQYEKVVAGAVDEADRDLTDLSSTDFDFSAISHYEPYRYIPFLSSAFSGSGTTDIEAQAQDYTRKIINQNTTWMFTIDVDSIVCDAQNYVISQSVTMNITATYHMPKVFQYLGLPETYELTAGDKVTVSDQDEFIRNVDFAKDLIMRAADALNLSETIGKPLGKLMEFAKKIFGR